VAAAAPGGGGGGEGGREAEPRPRSRAPAAAVHVTPSSARRCGSLLAAALVAWERPPLSCGCSAMSPCIPLISLSPSASGACAAPASASPWTLTPTACSLVSHAPRSPASPRRTPAPWPRLPAHACSCRSSTASRRPSAPPPTPPSTPTCAPRTASSALAAVRGVCERDGGARVLCAARRLRWTARQRRRVCCGPRSTCAAAAKAMCRASAPPALVRRVSCSARHLLHQRWSAAVLRRSARHCAFALCPY